LSQERINAYANASGDHNPIHLEQAAASAAGLPSTIAHGLLTLGVACALVERWAGEGAFVERISCRFSAPVRAGEELHCHARVIEVEDGWSRLELDALTERGERALSKTVLHLRRRP
ncbi:MAG: MaoC family dehydratase, partial [Candidatus Dormibacteria bacterium]